MAKLVVASLAVFWLMAFICSTGHVHGVGCFGSGRKIPRTIRTLMEKKPEARNLDEWKKLVVFAEKALADARIMDIKSAIDVIRQLPHVALIDHLDPGHAQELYEMTNISKGQCKNQDLPSSGLLLEVMYNEYKLPVLYKHTQDALNNYMRVCGLEDRYRDFSRWQSAKNGGKSVADDHLTLADRVLGKPSGPPENFHLCWNSLTALELMKDSNLNSELRCNDKEFIAKLTKGLGIRHSKWARDYVDYVLDNSRKICGHKDRLILDVDTILDMNYY